MNMFCGPVFQNALDQFNAVADHLEIPAHHRQGLIMPKRTIAVSVPLQRDDGSWAAFEGYRIQHQFACGPAKGGTRFSPDLELGEVAALSVWMSWKCALAGLPFGGAKGGIACDPGNLSLPELERLSRRYIEELEPVIGPEVDIMAPDMGTNEQVMAWMMDAYSHRLGQSVPAIVTGKPLAVGGIAGRREATGFGVALLAQRALESTGYGLIGATAIIQGFGNVGSVTAQYLVERGVRIVGIADQSAAYYNPGGFDLGDLLAHASDHGSLKGYSSEALIDPRALLMQRCDILVPAAREGVIDGEIAAGLQCRVVAEGANGPCTIEGDRILHNRSNEILVVPDILCSAGGVIVSYFEWVQNIQKLNWKRSDVMARLEEMLTRSFNDVAARARRDQNSLRLAATSIAVERVYQAHLTRGMLRH